MKKRSALGRGAGVSILLWPAIVALGAGCWAPPSSREGTGRAGQPFITHNGFSENSLSTNGLTQNGFSENGFSENGFSENGFSENGFSENGFSENGVSQYGLSPLEIMENDPNAVQFVRYAYSCAMPPGQTMTLTINGEAVTFEGSLGLAPEWGEDNGTCNDDCKRWVSACLLARTNAYGAHVEISIRAPRSIFQANGDVDSLERTKYLQIVEDPDPTKDEGTLFPLREGAYFGNIFNSKLAPDGTLVHDPKYYACAGPGSNVPQLTNRFCSSQGDGCIIYTGDPTSTTANPALNPHTWDSCTNQHPTCVGLDDAANPTVSPNHAAYSCTGADGASYKQVLTIYLKRPITVCGNHICEGAVPGAIYDSSAVPEDATSCPDDCHPGTWAKSVDLEQIRCTVPGRCYEAGPQGQIGNLGRRVAIAPNDDVMRLLDYIPGSTGNIDFGAPTGLIPPDNKSLLAAYQPDGTPFLSQRVVIDPALSSVDPTLPTRARAVTVDKDGHIIVAASSPLWVGKFDRKGGALWINDFPNVNEGIASAVITDGAGDVIATYDPETAGAPSFPQMVKLNGADGSFVWTTALDPVDTNIVVADGKLSIDGAGNVNYTDHGNVYRVGAGGGQVFARGAVEFGAKLFFTGVSTDALGNAFVAGSCESANFGTGPFAGPGSFVVKFNPAGAVDLLFEPYFQAGQVFPVDLHLDGDGNVIVAGGFYGDGTAPDFGAQPFNSWGSPDTFLFARSAATGKFVWAKQLALVTAGGLDALGLGSGGKVFASGGFDGSMLLDGYQLINSDPIAVNQQNVFIGSFRAPCGTPGCDVVPPVFDPRSIPGVGSMIGRPLIVYATARTGATVLYTPPTARNASGDTNYNGVVVNCLPASGATFPIGVTTVRCSATDPHGNTVSTSFPITVLASAGPVLLDVPPAIQTGATGPNGAVVSYRPPTAADQIDGQLPVACKPPPGSLFPIGITTVACSSIDHAEPPNETLATFPVEVTLVGQPTITVPDPGPVVGATKATGAIVKYAVSAKDAAGRAIPVACAPASGKLFPLGETKVTCSAKDAAGNQATETFAVLVRFKWSGFLPPIKNDGTSTFNLKSVVPVKFQLPNGIKDASAHLVLAKLTNGVPAPEQRAVPATNWNTGNLFRYDKSCNAYIFNMATKSLSKGQWRLRVDLHDTVPHTVDIALK
jgi:hypothetical protein